MNKTIPLLPTSPLCQPGRRGTPLARLAVALLAATSTALPAADFATSAQYAWAENAGWLNLKATSGGAKVLSDHLEGYVWHENLGWIRLGTYTGGGAYTYANTSNTNYGVNRSTTGDLSGYAWSENAGWINFAPDPSKGGGVSADAVTGAINGYAWAENVGWVFFAPYNLAAQPCGPGVAYKTGQWDLLGLPCWTLSPETVVGALGNGTPSNLPTGTYRSKWVLDKANPTQTGWVRLYANDPVATGVGYAFKSLVAPSGSKLSINGTETPVTNKTDACASGAGCAVITLTPPQTAYNKNNPLGNKLIGNPFAHNVEWSRVRIRVDGLVYTPTEAQAANILSNQIWLWNGTSYDTWDDASDPGDLQYFRGLFIRVLPGGQGKQIELLIPAEISTLPLSALPASGLEILAGATPARGGWAQSLLDWLIPTAAAETLPADGGDWKVRLRVENLKTSAKARALLGQRTGAETGYDPADLSSMAPFASPYLTLVFPQPGWGANKGDYASDFRPADGAPDQWNLELRSDPVGSQVVLRWEGDPAVLAHSRLTDQQTMKVIDPTDPAYAKGYPLTLTTGVRALTWVYLGD